MTNDQLIHPSVLRPGDTVGLITPATYVSDPDQLALAARTLKFFGLQVKFGKNVGKRIGYLGGSIDERLDDLHAMFADNEVQAVFAIRGGYGSTHLLDRIDYDLIQRHPKILLGYSDITALHLAIYRFSNLVTFHGPIVLARFSEFTQNHFRRALLRTETLGRLTNPPDSDPLRPLHTLRTVSSGQVRGPLIGGNLSLICSLMGTPYEIDTCGKILFLEDAEEQPYSIDRMLTQLRLAGKLDQAAGIIFGEGLNCRPRDFQPPYESSFSVGDVVQNILGKLSIPVLYGLTIGHTDDQLTLPLGVMATLKADDGELVVEESGVADR